MRQRAWSKGAFVVLALAVVGTAFGQARVTGSVSATLGGEERTWNTLALPTDEGTQGTATWSSIMGTVLTVSIQAHAEPRYAIEHAISIEVTTSGTMPPACPCTFHDATLTYWSTGSMFRDVYSDDAASVVIDAFEPNGDGTYRVAGSFVGTLAYHASVQAEPDTSRTLPIEGRFEVDALMPAPQ